MQAKLAQPHINFTNYSPATVVGMKWAFFSNQRWRIWNWFGFSMLLSSHTYSHHTYQWRKFLHVIYSHFSFGLAMVQGATRVEKENCFPCPICTRMSFHRHDHASWARALTNVKLMLHPFSLVSRFPCGHTSDIRHTEMSNSFASIIVLTTMTPTVKRSSECTRFTCIVNISICNGENQ